MTDPRVDLFKHAMLGQSGGGLDDIRIFTGAPRYQYGQGFGDVLRGIWRTIVPVAMRVGKTFFKQGAASLKEGESFQDSIKSAIKPTLRTALKHGGKALGKILEEQDAPIAAPSTEPLLAHQDERDVGTTAAPKQVGSGIYKRKRKQSKNLSSSKGKRIHYNF